MDGVFVTTVMKAQYLYLTGVHCFCFFCLMCSRIKDLAAHLQFIQDFSGTELMFGDVGLAFKMCKDSFHSLLQMLK